MRFECLDDKYEKIKEYNQDINEFSFFFIFFFRDGNREKLIMYIYMKRGIFSNELPLVLICTPMDFLPLHIFV